MADASAKFIRVLSIDGGGIRGLIPALVLAHLEHVTAQPAAAMFDVIVGTSTGGILALGLTVPNANGVPAFSAGELAQLYPQWGKQIFPAGGAPTLKERLLGRGASFSERMGNAARTAGSPFGGNPEFGGNARHTATGLEKALDAYFGTRRLSEALVEVLVTTFDTTNGNPVVLSRDASRSMGPDHGMAAVARATSAAPTFLPPQALIVTPGGSSSQLVDGGVWANNPVILGYHRGLRLAATRGLSPDRVAVVSLGTGAEAANGGTFDPARTWLGALTGLAGMATNTNIPDFVMRHHVHGQAPQRYWRLQTYDAGSTSALDDPTPERLDALTHAAGELLKRNAGVIEEVAAILRA